MIEYFNTICNFRTNNPVIKGGAIKSNDPILDEVKEALENLKKQLETKYNKFEGINFTIEASQGIAFFPNVLHICILPENQKVSDGIYVGICFDIMGKGAVIGCMESKTNPRGLKTVTREDKKLKLKSIINVDGGRPTTKYNNLFENPKEFYINETTESDFLAHIEKSLQLCLYNLKLITKPTLLQTSDYLNSLINEDQLEYKSPKDIQDERIKVAVSINLRRGQKKFRSKLIDIYGGKCCVTDCCITEMLEAAHIYPYKGEETNKSSNGLLLRADVHTLFDLGLLAINPSSYKVVISQLLKDDSYYKNFEGKKINLPKHQSDLPFNEYLNYHLENIFRK